MKETLILVGKYFLLMKRVFMKPEKWRIFWKQFIFETDKLIINSLPLVAFISLFIGAVLVVQTAKNINSPFIPRMYAGYLTRESLVLEFCSTMICLILAGKIGSNIASEIGTMRITEQIDAMEMMGVNSANYLILPKVTSATLFSPLIMLMSFILGLIGGYLTCSLTEMVTMHDYLNGIRFVFNGSYVTYSAIKTSVFCFIITSISSFFGFNAKGGSLGVGASATRAIVVICALILIFDLLLTQLLL